MDVVIGKQARLIAVLLFVLVEIFSGQSKKSQMQNSMLSNEIPRETIVFGPGTILLLMGVG